MRRSRHGWRKRLLLFLWAGTLLTAVPTSTVSDIFADAFHKANVAWGYNVQATYSLHDFGGCWVGSPAADANTETLVVRINKDCAWTPSEEIHEVLVTVIEHEIGHLLGLQHSADYHSVMFWQENGQHKEITRVDRYNARRLAHGVASRAALVALNR